MYAPELHYENDYQALLRTLIFKEGFGLFFIECSPSQAQDVIANIKQELSEKKIGELHLFKEAEDFYDKVAEFAAGKNFDILFVRGFEKLIFDYTGPGYGGIENYYNLNYAPKVLAHINIQRERIKEDFPLCFVFLLSKFALNYFIRRAPDFFDWRSGLFIFTSQEENIRQSSKIISQIGDYPKYLSLSSQQRKQIILSSQSLILQPDLVKANDLMELGIIYFIEGKYETALKCFDKILTIEPDNDMAWCYRGYALFMLERYEESIGSYSRATEIKPDKYEFFDLLGLAFDAFGHYDEAKKSFFRAGLQKTKDTLPEPEKDENELAEWLNQIGFKRNPFEGDHAENEPNFEEYFIEPIGFDELLKKSSTVLYAPSGGGKTACLKMVETFTCRNSLPEKKVFCITYDKFDQVIKKADNRVGSVTIGSHLEVLLNIASQRFKEYLIKYPETSAKLNKNYNGIDSIERLLEKTLTENILTEKEANELMSIFYRLIKAVGFDMIFVLIDKIDHTVQTKNNFSACVALLKPLIEVVPFMSSKGIYFKFFLPQDMQPLMKEFKAFSLGYVKPITLEWQELELKDILWGRLRSATQENRLPINSLDSISDSYMKGSIDREVLKRSKTPRDIVLKGREHLIRLYMSLSKK